MLYILPLGPLATNCYVLANEDKKAVIIDPAGDFKKLSKFLDEKGIEPVALLMTHCHYDHIGAVGALMDKYPGIRSIANHADSMLYERYVKGLDLPAYLKPENYSNFRVNEDVKEGDVVEAAGFKFKAYAAPGHTPGGMVYICDDLMFTGDTLFKGSMGRCDLLGGDEKEIMKSLKKIYEIEGDYKVLPGHEGASTLQTERETNPYMKMAIR